MTFEINGNGKSVRAVLPLYTLIILLIVAVLPGGHVQAQEVGDVICTGGFIMDTYCIDRGTLLDAPSVTTLKNPEQHSVHCLLDVSPCVGSPFEVLQDPTEDGALYTRWYRVSDNTLLRDLGSKIGDCDTCSGSDVEFGFRAEVVGTITKAADGDIPPTMKVDGVRMLEMDDMACGGNYMSDDVTNWTAIVMDDSIENPFMTADTNDVTSSSSPRLLSMVSTSVAVSTIFMLAGSLFIL